MEDIQRDGDQLKVSGYVCGAFAYKYIYIYIKYSYLDMFDSQ